MAQVDDNVLNFKKKNKLTDIKSEAILNLESGSEYRQRIVSASTELNLSKSLHKELENSNDVLPSNLGFGDPTISSSIVEYNSLVQQKNRLLRSAGEKNTLVIETNENIDRLKNSIKQSLNNQVSSLEIKLNELKREGGRFNSKISSIPTKERELIDIRRQQEIIAGLYSYLLKKKEETAISLAVTVPSAKIIDKAYGSYIPVSPKKNIIYLGGYF